MEVLVVSNEKKNFSVQKVAWKTYSFKNGMNGFCVGLITSVIVVFFWFFLFHKTIGDSL